MSTLADLPIIYGLDSAGTLRFVDDVPTGLDCGCLCPDPTCHQPLVAKNAGSKRIHHFAHQRGSCEWSVENVIMLLALDILRTQKRMAFPQLTYLDALEGTDVTLSKSLVLPIAQAELISTSGRGAPDILITCESRSGAKTFVLVIPLVHTLSEDERLRIAAPHDGIVVLDLYKDMQQRKKQLGKHFDRVQLAACYQDQAFIAEQLLNASGRLMSWSYNRRAEHELNASVDRRQKLLEQERAADAARKAERERQRAAEEAERERKAAEERAAQEQAKAAKQAHVLAREAELAQWEARRKARLAQANADHAKLEQHW